MPDTYKPTSVGVSISTWRTSQTQEGGDLIGYLDNTFFGLNVGHTNLDITLPNTPEIQKLVNKPQFHIRNCKIKPLMI